MCRKFITSKENQELLTKISNHNLKELPETITLNKQAYAIVLEDKKLKIKKLSFGYTNLDKIIYNARSETVLTKSLFKDDFLQRKAIFICNGYFEYNRLKEEEYFTSNSYFFLTGFYNQNNEFVLLTKKGDYLPREPLSITKKDAVNYLNNKLDLNKIEHPLITKANDISLF